MRFLLLILSLLAAAVEPALAQIDQPTATDSRLAGDAKRTRLIVDLTVATKVQAFALADPYRIIIDLPQTTFALPADAGKEGRGLVTAYRYGLIGPGRSRIVLDLSAPAVIAKSFVLDPVEGQPARLVVDLVATDRQTFLEAVAAARKADPERQALAAAQPAPPVVDPGGGLPMIVVDPGHGGIDTGAVTPKGDREKSIVLDFAKTLAAKIAATGRYRAAMTREDDSFVSLSERVNFARRNQATLFISVHADTLPDPFGVRGATVYTLSDKASDAESARYAEKENRADLIAGVDLAAEPDDVADILIDLTRRETKTFSSHFANLLTDHIKSAITLNKNARRSAGFMVLKAPDVPSVLLELGYLSNSQDTKLLMSQEWRDQAADAVVTAIDGFFSSKRSDIRDTSN